MIYCIDIDGTLLNTDGGNYASSSPIESRIKKVRELYSNGHTILLSTARNPIWYDLTEKQMLKFNIPYHALHVGVKVYADCYIDDKAINAKEFF